MFATSNIMLFSFVAPKLPPNTKTVNVLGFMFSFCAAAVLCILKISFLIGLDVYIALFSLKYFSVPLKLKAILFTNLDNILFASPGTEFCS